MVKSPRIASAAANCSSAAWRLCSRDCTASGWILRADGSSQKGKSSSATWIKIKTMIWLRHINIYIYWYFSVTVFFYIRNQKNLRRWSWFLRFLMISPLARRPQLLRAVPSAWNLRKSLRSNLCEIRGSMGVFHRNPPTDARNPPKHVVLTGFCRTQKRVVPVVLVTG